MDSEDDTALLGVLRAYRRVLGGVARAIEYLFFLAAATVSSLITLFALLFLPLWEARDIAYVAFGGTILLAFYASSVVRRINRLYRMTNTPTSREDDKPAGDWGWFGSTTYLIWAFSFAVGFFAGDFVPSALGFPVSLSVGTGLALILTYSERAVHHRKGDARDPVVGAYLLGTIPIYFVITPTSFPLDVVEIMLFVLNLGIAFFGVAVSLSLATRKRAAEVLHAASG